ncbi:hypothetical protein Bca4012_007352 [Brassica carinata]
MQLSSEPLTVPPELSGGQPLQHFFTANVSTQLLYSTDYHFIAYTMDLFHLRLYLVGTKPYEPKAQNEKTACKTEHKKQHRAAVNRGVWQRGNFSRPFSFIVTGATTGT